MNFEWDDLKAAAKLKKHGIAFEEAKTVFENPLAVIFDDELHSMDEQRELNYWALVIELVITDCFH